MKRKVNLTNLIKSKKNSMGTSTFSEIPSSLQCEDGMIISENISLDVSKDLRNNTNLIVFGSAGSSKTHSFIRPNLLNALDNTSYVCVDIAGELLRECKPILEQKGYSIKTLNLMDVSQSNKYNCFDYIHTEEDICLLTRSIINNTSPSHGTIDSFWESAETLLLTALIYFVYYHAQENNMPKNLMSVIKLLEGIDVSLDVEESETVKLFFNLPEQDKGLELFQKFLHASGKTLQSIIISLGCRLFAYTQIQKLEESTNDNIDLDKIGSQKTALFIILPSSATTFNFVAAMCVTQLLEGASNQNSPNYRIHVVLDEFGCIGTIPNLTSALLKSKSSYCSISIVTQCLDIIKELYPKQYHEIISYCGGILFFGVKDSETCKFISDCIGETTVQTSTYQALNGKAKKTFRYNLLSPSQIQQIDYDKCIYITKNGGVYIDNKYNY